MRRCGAFEMLVLTVLALVAPGSGVTLTDNELRTISEGLFTRDVALPQITASVQDRTSASETADRAARPLLGGVPRAAAAKDTVRLMQQLLDNYIPQSTARESYTDAEKLEESQFLDALMRTNVMTYLESTLKSKRLLTGTLRTKLNEIWFTQYRRGGRNIASSGFEHVFVGELKGGKVSGFHNWLNFRKEEQENDLDYKGHMRVLNFGNGKGKIIKARFVWMNQPKPVGSVFVGTTPELEVALYTLCFLAKPDQQCAVSLNNKRFNIQTWSYTNSGKKVIGSAFPNI